MTCPRYEIVSNMDRASDDFSVASPVEAADVIRARQQTFNRETKGCWELFAPHRQRVTKLLVNQPEDRRRGLSVIGAGNCNDLDLAALAGCFAEIHLVDLDTEALAAGVASQGMDVRREGLHLHGGVDVTGIAEQIRHWTPKPAVDERLVRDCQLLAEQSRVQLPGPVDAAVSVCLLSQLMEALNVTLGSQHPQFTRLAAAVRTRHIEQLVNSVRPGGRAIIVTDVASSEFVTELRTATPRELPALLERILRDGPLLTGVNPFHIQRLCREWPSLAPRVADVRVSHPWTWRFPSHMYVVCAVEIRRSDDFR
jgi:hypothetical protein